MMRSALLLLAVASCGSALKCYTCKDCDDVTFFSSGNNVETDCGDNLDSCIKMVNDDKITKSCGVEQVCNALDGVNSVIGTVNDVFGSSVKTGESFCCDDDLCNSAPTTAAAFAALVPALLAALLW